MRAIIFRRTHFRHSDGGFDRFTEWGPHSDGFSAPSHLSGCSHGNDLQFTGFFDKDKAVIYEDDICELEVYFAGTNPEGDGYFHVVHTGIVKYTPSNGFHLKICKSWDIDSMIALTVFPKIKDIVSYRTKVIGNIHQHKHLLK